MSSEGIIIVYLKEWYQNSIEKAKAEEDAAAEVASIITKDEPAIEGPTAVYPYDKKNYPIRNAENRKNSSEYE